MNTQQLRRMRILLTALILITEMLHLAWEYMHGGVKSHHLLNRPDLPAISNWWGALLLPLLAWLLLGPTLRRVHTTGAGKQFHLPIGIVAGFAGSLLYGVCLAVAFTQQQEAVASYLFLGMFMAALVLPAYRPEYVLGFMLGMTFTFGAVLPTIAAALVAAVSAVFHFLIRLVSRFIFTLRFPVRRSL